MTENQRYYVYEIVRGSELIINVRFWKNDFRDKQYLKAGNVSKTEQEAKNKAGKLTNKSLY